MKYKAIYTSVAGALVLGGATMSYAAQEIICDRQPTSTTPASCVVKGTSQRVMVPADEAHRYVIVPTTTEGVVVQERVVTTTPGTPVEAVTMTYYVEEPYPFPSPEVSPVQTRVYVPTEPRATVSGPPMTRDRRNPNSD